MATTTTHDSPIGITDEQLSDAAHEVRMTMRAMAHVDFGRATEMVNTLRHTVAVGAPTDDPARASAAAIELRGMLREIELAKELIGLSFDHLEAVFDGLHELMDWTY